MIQTHNGGNRWYIRPRDGGAHRKRDFEFLRLRPSFSMRGSALLWPVLQAERDQRRTSSRFIGSREGSESDQCLSAAHFFCAARRKRKETMELSDEKTDTVIDQMVVVLPERQSDISSTQAGQLVRITFPESLGYVDFKHSYLTFLVEMSGRGQPILTRSAGMSSLWNSVRVYSGTGGTVLEETIEANTLAAQKFLYTKSQSADNLRSAFEGFQLNDSYTQNIFWNPPGGTSQASWAYPIVPVAQAGAGVPPENQPTTAKKVMAQGSIQSPMFTTDGYMPTHLFQGLRAELLQEQTSRALMYTTGDLGMTNSTSVCPNFNAAANPQTGTTACNAICTNVAIGGDGNPRGTATGSFGMQITSTGSNADATGPIPYVVGSIYALYDSQYSTTRTIIGYGRVAAGGLNGNGLLSSGLEWYATAAGKPPPCIGTQFVVGQDAAQTVGATGAPVGIVQTLLLGNALMADANGSYFVEAGVGSVASALTNTSINIGSFFGSATSMKNPERVLNGNTNSTATGLQPTDLFPLPNNPFAIGDSLIVSDANSTTTNSHGFGVIIGFGMSTTSTQGQSSCRIFFSPNRTTCIVAGLPTDVGVGSISAAALAALNPGGTLPTGLGLSAIVPSGYSFGSGLQGYCLHTQRTFTGSFVLARTISPQQATLSAAIANKPGFTIRDLQYQVRRVQLDSATVKRDSSAAASASGYTMSIPSVLTVKNNLQHFVGVASEILNFPRVSRAFGLITTPLPVGNQFTLNEDSFAGESDHLVGYQYSVGGQLHPLSQVETTLANLATPLMSSQHYLELRKTLAQFDTRILNLENVNFSSFNIGRSFCLPGTYFDLEAQGGDLNVRLEYGEGTSLFKTLVSFLAYDREIVISNTGIKTSA